MRWNLRLVLECNISPPAFSLKELLRAALYRSIAIAPSLVDLVIFGEG